MSRQIVQPSGQKHFDNVAIVRLEIKGKRFEVATYKNKVQQFREGIETKLDEVFQIREIFEDVKTGRVADKKTMQSVFGTANRDAIATAILNKGRIQVNALERKQELDRLTGEIANLACDHSIYTYNHQALEPILMEKALKQHGFNVRLDKPAKVQALQAIPFLAKAGIPLARAPMEVTIKCPTVDMVKCKQLLAVTCCTVQNSSTSKSSNTTTFSLLISPDPFTHLQSFAWKLNWTVEISQFRYRAPQDDQSAGIPITVADSKLVHLPHDNEPPLWECEYHWCSPSCVKDVAKTFAECCVIRKLIISGMEPADVDEETAEQGDPLFSSILTTVMQYVGLKPWLPWSNAPGIRASEKKLQKLHKKAEEEEEEDPEKVKLRISNNKHSKDEEEEAKKKKKKNRSKRSGKKKQQEDDDEDSDAELENYSQRERARREKLREQKEKDDKEKQHDSEDEFDYGSYESDGNYSKYGKDK